VLRAACRADRLDQTVATECKGDGDLLQGLTLKNTKTGETSELPVNGLFYAIGEWGGGSFRCDILPDRCGPLTLACCPNRR
jgi:thioredoxin reductase